MQTVIVSNNVAKLHKAMEELRALGLSVSDMQANTILGSGAFQIAFYGAEQVSSSRHALIVFAGSSYVTVTFDNEQTLAWTR